MNIPKEFENKSLYIECQHTDTFKTFIEGLKDILSETIFEIISAKNTEKTEREDEEGIDEEVNIDYEENIEENAEENVEEKENIKTANYNGDHIKILTLDNNKTMLIKVLLYGNQFSKFYCKKKNLDIGINLTELHIHVKTIDKTETLLLYINENDKQNLRIDTSNEGKNCAGNSKIKLLDLDKYSLDLPKIDFNAHIIFNTEIFHKLCKSMSALGEFIEIKCTKKAITFSCIGPSSSLSKTYYSGKDAKIDYIENGPPVVQGLYELKSFMLFQKFQSISTELEIFMSNDFPISIQYTIAALGIILYCLNPAKVDADDEDDEEAEEFTDEE